MSNFTTVHSFNTSVVLLNAAHSVARGATAVAAGTAQAGQSFWAGALYAHKVNMETGKPAPRLTAASLAAATATLAAATPEAAPAAPRKRVRATPVTA